MTLKAAGLRIDELPQTSPNTTRMGQALFDLLRGRNLTVYVADDLREQALNTVAVESPRGWRLAKDKTSKKIDAIVALAMACVAAMDHDATRVVVTQEEIEKVLAVNRELWRPSPWDIFETY